LPLATTLAAAATATTAAAAATTTAAIGRLLERIDLPLHEVAVELAVRIICSQLQGGFVRLHGISPLGNGLLRSRLLELLPGAVQRVAQVVVGVLLVSQPLRITRWSGVD
jgi:hypothetical protein